jgi:hypothetical protein
MVKKSGSGSGIRNEQAGSYFLELRSHFLGIKILKSFDADPGSGMEKIRIRDPGWKKSGFGDPGWKKFGSGIRINIPDPQHCERIRQRKIPSS